MNRLNCFGEENKENKNIINLNKYEKITNLHIGEDYKSFNGITLEHWNDNGNEPALFNGNIYLMTWRCHQLEGYYTIDKQGSKGGAAYFNPRVDSIMEKFLSSLNGAVREYKAEQKMKNCITTTEGIEEFLGLVFIDSLFQESFGILSSMVLTQCGILGFLKDIDYKEFIESNLFKTYIIQLMWWFFRGYCNSGRSHYDKLVMCIVQKGLYEKIEYDLI